MMDQQRKMGVKLTPIAAAVVIGLVIIGAIYFLFFAPTPAFEVIVPPPLQTAEKISQLQIDPANVINSSAFRSLRVYAPLPSAGLIGRANPFLPL